MNSNDGTVATALQHRSTLQQTNRSTLQQKIGSYCSSRGRSIKKCWQSSQHANRGGRSRDVPGLSSTLSLSCMICCHVPDDMNLPPQSSGPFFYKIPSGTLTVSNNGKRFISCNRRCNCRLRQTRILQLLTNITDSCIHCNAQLLSSNFSHKIN